MNRNCSNALEEYARPGGAQNSDTISKRDGREVMMMMLLLFVVLSSLLMLFSKLLDRHSTSCWRPQRRHFARHPSIDATPRNRHVLCEAAIREDRS